MTESPEADGPPPLSVAQEALWYLSLLAPGRLTYNETISIRKDGPLDAPALRLAFNEIVRRHEAWRTTFDVVAGEPVQVVGPPPSFPLPIHDLSALSHEQAETQAVQTIADFSRVPYDLRRGPLVRPRLFRFPDDHHRLYLAMHHLVFDGVTVTRVVLPELIALYDAFTAGRPSPLAEPPTRYADYARWEQRWISDPRAQRRLQRWREHLTPPPVLTLELDHPRPSERRLGGGAIGLSLSADTVERLRGVGQSVGATLFQVLATGWASLLHRYSGQAEAVFATAADLRQRPEHQLVAGCSLTPLALRVDVSGDPTFAELVLRVRNELLDGLDQLVPFERVVRELRPAGAANANPIYQTMIVLEPATAPAGPDWSLHQIDSVLANAVGAFKLDLELQLDERADGHIAGQLIYDRDLFEPATVRQMVDHWVAILSSASEDPSRTVSRIPMLTEAERDRQLIDWNATTVERPLATAHELIEARTLEQADAPAVSDGSETISYAELNRRAGSLADRLFAAGVRSGDVVALLSRPSVELVIGALGALKAGGTHLLLDPAQPTAELRFALEDADVATVLVDGDLARSDLVAGLQLPAGRLLTLADPDQDRQATSTVPEGVGEDAVCCLCYSSRAAGRPNGVLISHASVVNLATALAAELGIGPTDTVLVLAPTLFSAPGIELWTALIAGSRILLAPAEVVGDGKRVSRLIASENVTFVHASPSVWRTLIDTGLRSARGLRALSEGERLSPTLAEEILDRCRVLWNAYGAAETGGCSTLARVVRSAPPTIGRPIANTRVYVVDRHREPVPVGVSGELLVAGDGLASGYLNRPELTSESFIDDPVGPGVAYRTGDLARWLPDGRLQLQFAETGVETSNARIRDGSDQAASIAPSA